MKQIIMFIAFILGIMFGSSDIFAGEYNVKKYGPYQMTQVDRYLDGDSFEGWVSNFIYQTTFVRVRIRGIDAPEKRGSEACEKAIAEQSKQYLMSLLENSTFVILDNLDYDNFGRTLADVTVDKGDVGTLMIQSNMAHKYSERDKIWCTSG